MIRQADLEYRRVLNPTEAFLEEYTNVPMLSQVKSKLQPEKVDRGLGGILLREVPVEPYTRDLGEYDRPSDFPKKRDISPWGFFSAYDRGVMIAGATVACKTKEVIMLDGRDDLCLLWDIRVDDAYKHLGIGSKLLKMALDWATEQGFSQMKIECQNNNVPAIRLYHQYGAVLCTLDEYMDYNDPESRALGEIGLIWYIDLQRAAG